MSAPELELDPIEAKRLADAGNKVARQYPLTATEKARAWIQLGIVASNVYAPRGVAYWHRTRRPAIAAPPPIAAPQPPSPASPSGNGAAATPSQMDPLAMVSSQAGA